MGQDTGQSDPSSGDSGPPSQRGTHISRRAVLRAGTIGAAAAGAVAAFPSLVGELVSSGTAASPGASKAPAPAVQAEPVAEGLIFAHIRNAATGDISLYVGEREIVYRDLSLVQQLARAAQL